MVKLQLHDGDMDLGNSLLACVLPSPAHGWMHCWEMVPPGRSRALGTRAGCEK